ncbi:hypothetical protein [Cognatishimia sp.]|uniref:hypothetical protein n=1 Tax=Cognatishimia sp. TaxID=2211648 RepID=UPI003511F807
MIADIWGSFMRLPLWVKIWMAVWLVPVNFVSLWFWGQGAPVPGTTVALLANLGMAVNVPIMMRDRGMSNAMALPHLVLWTPLVILIALGLATPEGDPAYRLYLTILLVTNVISLGFDFKDGLSWWRGDRDIV